MHDFKYLLYTILLNEFMGAWFQLDQQSTLICKHSITYCMIQCNLVNIIFIHILINSISVLKYRVVPRMSTPSMSTPICCGNNRIYSSWFRIRYSGNNGNLIFKSTDVLGLDILAIIQNITKILFCHFIFIRKSCYVQLHCK